MTPALGFRTGPFTDLTADQAASELARLGYDCMELCLESPDVRPENMDEAGTLELRRRLDQLPIKLASVSYHGDKDPLPERRKNQERAIHIAHWLGAAILVLNGERVTDLPRQWAEHVDRFQTLSKLAAAQGVTLAIEPEPLLAVGNSMDMAKMLQLVNSPSFKVNLDIGACSGDRRGRSTPSGS